jgi:lipopolysaccharide/colanic/teichoic acid biosynthesis glycosyltransferase
MSIIMDPQKLENRNQDVADGATAACARISVSPYFRWKNLPGFLVALALCLPGLPLILMLVLVVRISSRGPAIYRQVRVGRNGRTFTIFKLRTMRLDAEAATGPTWASADDPRVTPIGRFIRALHLDELPQLFNVLLGDMALVGPRPERPEFTQLLGRKIPGYLDRLEVRPGITGLAQINLPPDTDLESVRRKVVLDREYVESANSLMDLRILVCTCFRMVGIHGTVTRRLLGLERWDVVVAATRPAAAAEADRAAAIPAATSTPHSNGHNGAAKMPARAVHKNLPR